MAVIRRRWYCVNFSLVLLALALIWPTPIGSLKKQPFSDTDQLLSTRTEGKIKKSFYDKFIGTDLASELRRLHIAKRLGGIQQRYEGPFPCASPRSFRSQKRPTSVHKLKPGDVDVVAAMGDSLAAGMGATSVRPLQSLIENRGFSFCIGGFGEWMNFLTLPNILKLYNPHLVGFSSGTGSSVDEEAGFNVGEPGALSRQMLYQAKVLVERIKKDPRVHFHRDWKLLTLMIGNNDLCSEMCYLKDPAQIVDVHYKGVRDALDYLRDNLPRTLVNVVPMSKVALLSKMEFPSSCYLTHTVFCSCIFGPKFYANDDHYSEIGNNLQQATIRAVEDGGYGWRHETFAAVVQPYLVNGLVHFLPPGTYNNFTSRSILRVTAPDCFHYNQFGNAIAANSLWNSMLQPVGRKEDHEVAEIIIDSFLCPSDTYPYFFTNRNSAQVYS